MNAAEQPTSEAPPIRHRRVIHATCITCGSVRGFANLVIRKTPDGRIELDVHATGGCVIELEEPAAVEVWGQLGEWLGQGPVVTARGGNHRGTDVGQRPTWSGSMLTGITLGASR